MALKPYENCPCGSGKKVKFCCGDLADEIEKIQRMLASKQRAGCLEYVEKLDAQHPNRTFLKQTKAMLLTELGRTEEARQTVEESLAADPTNPVTLAEKALVLARDSQARAAVDALQDALDACNGDIPSGVYQVIGTVAEALLVGGQLFAARGHLLLMAGMNPEDKQAVGLLVEINMSEQLPLLMKDAPHFEPSPEGEPWSAEFESAVELARKARWRAAAEKLTALAQQGVDARSLWRNLVVLRGWLGDDAGAIEALGKLASPDAPLEDAVEATALAQIMDADAVDDDLKQWRAVHPITDVDRLQERLASDDRLSRVPIDPSALAGQDGPPPRSVFWLLDRPAAKTGVDIARDAIPSIIGMAFVYGRETDREARLEVNSAGDANRDAADKLLVEVGGDALGAAGEAEVVGAQSSVEGVLRWSWRLPDDTPDDHAKKLFADKRREVYLKDWPEAPQKVFDGKTPRQAAADPAGRIKVLAAVMLLEEGAGRAAADFDFNELRTALGLPTLDVINPADVDVKRLPVARLARLDVTSLADDELLVVFQRAQMVAAAEAMKNVSQEMIGRPSLVGKVDRAELYGLLASLETDVDQAGKHLDDACSTAETAGQSPARWRLEKFALCLKNGRAAEAQSLFEVIKTRHASEPGVGQMLMDILTAAGVIGPDGRPMPAAAGAQAANMAPPGGEAAKPGELWTPGGETAKQGKSALWVPGMD